MNKQTVKGLVVGAALATVINVSGIAQASTNVLKGYFHDTGWWSASAEWTKDNGLMNGVAEGEFGGDQYVTRGQLAQVLKNLSEQGKFAGGTVASQPVQVPASQPTQVPASQPTQPGTFTNSIALLDASTVTATISKDANSKWGTDYQMVKYEIDQQTEAYNSLKSLNIDSKVKQDTLKAAEDKWGNDFQMVQYEFEQQMQAYNQLNK